MSTQIPINVSAWWLIIMPVLLIFIISIIVLIVIIKDKSEEDTNENSVDKTLTSWIKKKDLLYWLLIICLGTISLLTFKYKDATEVISHWGFAGTIVSIILAVVAIGFTLYQTLSSNLSSEKIAESAEKIEKVTNALDSELLLESSDVMNKAAEFLKEKMYLIEEKLHSLDSEQKRFNEIAAGFSNINKNENNDKLVNDYEYSINNFMDAIYIKLPFYPRLYIYAYFSLNSIGILVDEIIQNELIQLFINYEKQLHGGEDRFIDGASFASHGATISIVQYLGIFNQFIKSDEKENIIGKCKQGLLEQVEYVKVIDNFVSVKGNNK